MSPTTVLIADDNRISARLIEESLRAEGYNVQVAGDGKKALAQAMERTPDLIVSDVMMPGMDGYELCRRLRAGPRTSDIPIILLTSRAGIEEKRRGFEAGADDYLVKPVNPVELRLRIAALFARSRARIEKGPAQTRPSRVIAVFSLRGGAGATSLAANLAVILAQVWKIEVPLVDLDLGLGLGALMLNLNPRHSWLDLANYRDALEPSALEDCLCQHDSGVKLLAAPPVPTTTSRISPGMVSTVLNMLRTRYEYTIIDTASDFSDTTLAALDAADMLLLPCPPDRASIKVTLAALGVFASLGYGDRKLVPIVNRTFAQGNLPRESIEAALGIPIRATIPYEPLLFVESANRGRPLVLTHPRASASVAIEELAHMISRPETGTSL